MAQNKSYIDEKVAEIEAILMNVARLADKGDDTGYGKAIAKLCGDIETTLQEAYSKGREDERGAVLKHLQSEDVRQKTDEEPESNGYASAVIDFINHIEALQSHE